MPVLHSQFNIEGKTKEGKVVRLPPALGLVQRGPVLQVTVAVVEQIATELVKQGKSVQPPVAGLALIDTGASMTCIDDEAAQQLQLPVIDVVKMASASHPSHQANVYPIRISIAGLPMGINAPRAVGAALKAHGLVVLIGRDILAHCTLHSNGMAGEITLAI